MTNKPKPPRECRTCGIELMDCAMTNECDSCFDKRTVPTPEPEPDFLKAQEKWRSDPDKYEREAGTPETPSGPPCPCGYDASLGTMVEEAAHRSDCPKAKGETPSGPWPKAESNSVTYEDEIQEPQKCPTCHGYHIGGCHKEETPSALSAVTDHKFIAQDCHDHGCQFLVLHEKLATAEREINEYGDMDEDMARLKRKLATAQQTIEDLLDCASLEGNAKATERALEAEKKLATAEREIVDLKDSLNETEEAWRVRAELQEVAEAELARVEEAAKKIMRLCERGFKCSGTAAKDVTFRHITEVAEALKKLT